MRRIREAAAKDIRLRLAFLLHGTTPTAWYSTSFQGALPPCMVAKGLDTSSRAGFSYGNFKRARTVLSVC
eukprot:596076-Amphidinium_carterae.1